MIHQLNIYGKDKVQVAIDRLKAFEPPEGYYLAFSGGKDSVCIKALADMAEVKYDAHYNLTSVDPPELVQFIKSFEDVQIDRPKDKDGNQVTMWNLIPRKKMPPTRIVRYCCKELKEMGGQGRMVVTGVRWAESPNRKYNHGEITVMTTKKKERERLVESGNFSQTNKGGVVLNNDNDDSRKMVEQCYKQTKTVVNPIIDWTDEDVWEFIREYNIPYCKLYDEGYKRLGCIGCPMGSVEHRKAEFERYPKYEQAYMRAFERMLNNIGGGTPGKAEQTYSNGIPNDTDGKIQLLAQPQIKWKNTKELMEWWIK